MAVKPAKKPKRTKKAVPKVRTQYAALPWRAGADGAFEVLLITSRETRRWVIPKGWPIAGLSAGFAAAREAYEEAGVVGYASISSVGVYRYDKRLATGRVRPVAVEVFSLQVSEEHLVWPEKDQREKLWTGAGEAADLVDEPELSRLIRAFRPFG